MERLSELRDKRDRLSARRDELEQTVKRICADVGAAGRKFLDRRQDKRVREALAQREAISDHIRELDEDIEREEQIAANPLLKRIREKATKMEIRDRDSGTYRQHGENGNSYVRDLVNCTLNRDYDGSSRERLMRHAADVQTRAIDRTDGSGGYAVPPAWLTSQYVELARPGKAFANLCTTAPLPAGTDSINLPKLATGTATAFQTADNVDIENTDLTDTFVSAPVKTIAGEQDLSLQLLDQSPIAFDQVVFADLIASHAVTLDKAVISGDGSGNGIVGVHHTQGIQSLTCPAVTLPAVYGTLANAIQKVHDTRFLPPTGIVMHPRRWGWLLSLLDDNQRPLFAPASNALNAAGILTNVASQQVVGQIQGVPVITDSNVPITSGGGDEDRIYVARFEDLYLWETGVRARVLPQTLAQGLSVALQVYSYVAFTGGRHPESVVEINGLTAPSFLGS
jgi:HK97 family phage major capsid protein